MATRLTPAPQDFNQSVDDLYQNQMGKYLRRLPLIRSNYYSQKFGCDLYFKIENLQHTGSFKVRGALAKAFSLPKDRQGKDFIAASAGNHGLGVCYAAKIFGVKARIYMPKTTPAYKIRKIVELGGEPIVVGQDFDATNQAAMAACEAEGLNYFHPFSDEDVIRGQAGIGMEILEDLPNPDIITCSIGGGGLIAGIAAYVKNKSPNTLLYGVETDGAHSMYTSVKEGKIVTLSEISSMAESIAVRRVSDLTFEYVKSYVDDLFVVSDDESFLAQKDLLQQEKLLAEPAMTCCIAALEKGLFPNIEGKKVVVVLCGGNYPVEKLAKTLQGETLLSYKTPRETLIRKFEKYGITVKESPELESFLTDIKGFEIDGYGYNEAEASFELLARQRLCSMPEYFKLESFRVFNERRYNDKAELITVAEAAVKITLDGQEVMTVADSLYGPVNALDMALRKALTPAYPILEKIKLTDYTVRILNPHDGSKAITRAIIESRDQETDESWVTVGLSKNIIDASYQALYDSFVYRILKTRK